MFEAPSGKTNHSVSVSQPAMGLSTIFVVGATNFEGLSTGSPRLSRTTERACDHQSMLIVVSGLPGTGKSALADRIGQELGAVVLSVDPIEAAMLESGIEQSFATGYAAYRIVSTIVEANLALGQTLIIDAVSSVAAAKAWWPVLASTAGVSLAIIECICSDSELHRSRLEARVRGIGSFPEPSWDDVERRRQEWVPWTIPQLVVDAVAPLDVNVAKALAYVAESADNKTPKGTSLP
jgi:predicted kinase